VIILSLKLFLQPEHYKTTDLVSTTVFSLLVVLSTIPVIVEANGVLMEGMTQLKHGLLMISSLQLKLKYSQVSQEELIMKVLSAALLVWKVFFQCTTSGFGPCGRVEMP